MLKSITEHTSEKKWMYTPKEGEQFFFMHIPKTGGTTFRKMLTNHFPEGSYYPNEEDLTANGGKYLSQKVFVNKNNITLTKPLVIGHYDFNLIKHLNPDVKVLVFFRNPIDRILSHVRHILEHDPEWKDCDPNVLIENRINSLRLIQSKFMGLEKKNFSAVIKNLREIEFIGILEYFNESVALYNKMFNQQLELISPKNTSNKILDNISPKTMSLLTRSTIAEARTYNRAFEHFKKRCKMNKISLSK